MLEAKDVTVAYQRKVVLAGVSLAVEPGLVIALSGPSGCGKSTLARVLALMLRPRSGQVSVDGVAVRGWRQRADRRLRTSVALIYQSPRQAVDPRLTLTEVIAEPLAANGRPDPERVRALARETGLTEDLLTRRPHEVSEGQLQRACLARALSLEPRYLICDEMTTMLDASTQALLVGVVDAYRERTGAGVLAISHDTVLLDRWADRVIDFTGPGVPAAPAATASTPDA
ncbi:ABC transporter ATP-binding protein [Spongiactinospora gelatinilytica]|uniref:ABC transporter ATP-binding protein n=1 Tax=Spongiactinospora gelatinilytica TaxID=2666298 RepID=A0A2W2GKU8_9ACTN|nr:ATP-binding cassette domain-containing protein [Spongiactinospora gelatinilytica]PZG43239.1 ABC transporter ATP-binding protein [Spongiactinospora gelatinilytica]